MSQVEGTDVSAPIQNASTSLKASLGNIDKFLERKGLSKISLHVEGAEMVQRSSPIDELNSDQTSLFYSKIHNMIYGGKEAKNNLAGVKEMKSKDRITLYKVAVNPAVFVSVKGLFECYTVP